MSWRKILMLTVALLAGLLATTWIVLQQTGAAAALVRSLLRDALAADFTLRDAEVDLGQGTLTLRGLRIGDPARSGADLAEVASLRIGVDTNPLGDILRVHEVEVRGLALRLDLASGRLPTLGELLRQTGDRRAEPPERLPPLRVRDSTIEVRFRPDLPPLRLTGLTLDLLPVRGSEQQGQLTGSARWPDLGLLFELTGSADARTGEARATARLVPTQIDDGLLGRIAAFVPDAPRTGLTGRLQQLVLWVEQRPAAQSGEPLPAALAGIDLHADELGCTLAEVPYPIAGATLEASCSTADDGTVAARIRQAGPLGDLDVRGRVTGALTTPTFELRAAGRGIVVGEASLGALGRLRAGRNVIAALQPTAGLVDVDLFLRRHPDDREDLDLDLTVRDAALTYHGFGGERRVGFPLPLQGASGRVHIRDHIVTLDDLRATLQDGEGGEVHCHGTVPARAGLPAGIHVDVHVPAVSFTPALRTALGTLLRDDGRLFDELSPTGRAQVWVRVRSPADGDWQVRIEPLGCGLTWHRFPLPLADVTGAIHLRDEGATFDVTGRHGDGRVTARGRLGFPPAPGESWQTAVWVGAEDLTLGDPLRAAATTLAPDLVELWRALDPRGTLAADVTVWNEDGDPEPAYDAHLTLRDGTVTAAAAGRTLGAVAGEVFVHGHGREQRVELDGLRARLADGNGRLQPHAAQLALAGSVHLREGRNAGEDLTAVVRDLPLDDELRDSLDRLGALDRATWDVLRPSGRVDLVLRRQRAAAATAASHDLTVHLRTAASDAPMLPARATDVTGQLRVRDGQVEWTDLRARVADAQVACSAGYVRPAADAPDVTEVMFDVSADRFPVDDRLARLFAGPMRQAVLDRRLQGSVRVPQLRLWFRIPPAGGGELATTLAGSLQPIDVSLQLGTRVEAFHGLIRLQESRIDGDGGALHGTIENGSCRIFGQGVDALAAGFVADARQVQFGDFALRLHGGRIRGRPGPPPLVYRMPGSDGGGRDGVLSLNLELDGISLADLLREGGYDNPPYSGTLRGHLQLDRLEGADFVDMVANGRLQLADGNLGTVPVFTAIYAQLSVQDRPRFEGGTLAFRVADRRLTFDELLVRSPLLQISGTGSMTMEGYVDIRLVIDNLFGGAANMLLLPQIFQSIASSLVRFHLYGHLRDLRTEPRWITERDPRRLRLTPVPPRLQRPKRPAF